MSKTLQDYRNIVKILKYKLIKLREQNEQLEDKIGIQGNNKHSSYKQKIKKYQSKNHVIAKNILLFLNLADKCQINGITPQMIYRIADQKRQKKIHKQKMIQTLKKIKLKLDQTIILQLCSYIDFKRDNIIDYDNYMSCLCAFQINTQKYPTKNPRSFSQICLIKFARYFDNQFRTFEDVYSKINKQENDMSFDDFFSYGRNNIKIMNQIELTAVFIALDLQQNCTISKNNFVRQLKRIKSTQDNISNEQTNTQRGKKNTKQQKQIKQAFQEQIETGIQAGKVEKKKKQQPKQIRKATNEVTKALNLLRSMNLTLQNLLNKLLDESFQKKTIKAFSFFDIYNSAISINKSIKKTDIMNIFKLLANKKQHGSLNNSDILKFWLLARQRNESPAILYKLLKRQIFCKNYLIQDYFKSFTKSQDPSISQQLITKSFKSLNFDKQQIKQIVSMIGKINLSELIKKLANQNQNVNVQIFKKFDRNKTDIFDFIIKKIKPQFIQADFYPKLNRISKQPQKWKTIFTNQWACWKYCYDTIKTLIIRWKDPQFGPTSTDKFGYNSIVGNQNQPPIAIPPQQQIQWINHFQLIKRKGQGNIIFSQQKLASGCIDQGSIGNCWFISAVSIITQNSKYLMGSKLQEIAKQNLTKQLTNGIIPEIFAGFRNYGIYVFKFFKNYRPAYVLVDELFPVQLGTSNPIFAHSTETGLQWPILLEKAYAKLHHTYSALISGDIAQGLSDLTSCLPIKQAVDKKLGDQILNRLFDLKKNRQLMGCSITPNKVSKQSTVQKPVQLDGQNCGLVYNHAYSISDVFKIEDRNTNQQFQLLRIRNPWGQGEWCLEWSQNPRDGDDQNNKLKIYLKQIEKYYQKLQKQAKERRQDDIQGYKKSEDGIFLMSFQDWLRVYTSLFIGMNLAQNWSGKYIEDTWSEDMPSGILSPSTNDKKQKQKFVNNNFQYRINLNQDSDILLVLTQIDGRLFRGQKYPYKQICNPCSLLVFKLNNNDTSLKSFQKQLIISPLKIENRRQITFWKNLKKGTYIIIPATKNFQDNIFQDKYPSFNLAIYHSCEQKYIDLKKIRDQKGQNKFKVIQRFSKTTKKVDNQKEIQQFVKKLVEIKNNL